MQESRSTIRSLPVWILLGATIIVGIAWALSAPNLGSYKNRDTVPLIISPDGPTKVKPDDPGGVEILYPDVEILKNSSLEAKGTRVKVLPAPEIPIKLPEWSEESKPEIEKKTTRLTEAPSFVVSGKKNTDVEDQSSKEAVKKITQSPKKLSDVKVLVVEKQEGSVETSKSLENDKNIQAEDDLYKIQVGATQNEKLALGEALRITKAHKNILDSRVVQVVKVDLGAKGVWYRLRILNLLTRSISEDMCKRLKLLEVNCFVVK